MHLVLVVFDSTASGNDVLVGDVAQPGLEKVVLHTRPSSTSNNASGKKPGFCDEVLRGFRTVAEKALGGLGHYDFRPRRVCQRDVDNRMKEDNTARLLRDSSFNRQPGACRNVDSGMRTLTLHFRSATSRDDLATLSNTSIARL